MRCWYNILPGWWFQTFSIFHNIWAIWDNPVKTTNQLHIRRQQPLRLNLDLALASQLTFLQCHLIVEQPKLEHRLHHRETLRRRDTAMAPGIVFQSSCSDQPEVDMVDVEPIFADECLGELRSCFCRFQNAEMKYASRNIQYHFWGIIEYQGFWGSNLCFKNPRIANLHQHTTWSIFCKAVHDKPSYSGSTPCAQETHRLHER